VAGLPKRRNGMQKKIIVLLLILAAAVGFRHYKNKIESSVQKDPVQTVNAFMETAEKLSGLIWDESEKKVLLSEMKKWSKASKKEGERGLPESFKKYDIEDSTKMFKDRGLGKTALSTFCLFRFSSFTVGEAEITPTSAKVKVKFMPDDFLGFGKTIKKLGVPEQEKRKAPSVIPFHLKKYGFKWYIVDIGGLEGKLIRASYRLRRYE